MKIICAYCKQDVTPDNLCKHVKVIEFGEGGYIKSIQFGPEEYFIPSMPPVYIPVPYPQPYPIYPTYPRWVGPTWIYSGTTNWNTITSPNASTSYTVTT